MSLGFRGMRVKQLLREVCYERAGSFSSIHGRELSHIPPGAQVADPVSCWPLYTMAFCCCYHLPEVSTGHLVVGCFAPSCDKKIRRKQWQEGRERGREVGFIWLTIPEYCPIMVLGVWWLVTLGNRERCLCALSSRSPFGST